MTAPAHTSASNDATAHADGALTGDATPDADTSDSVTPGPDSTADSSTPGNDAATDSAALGCKTAADCPPAAACQVSVCSAGSCQTAPMAEGTACDDGNPCSQADFCSIGQCSPGLQICQCETTAGCGKFEDGNLCNGTLYCDKSAPPPYLCKINPATLTVCDASQNNACQTNACVPATGGCALSLVPVNTPCSDGDACTVGDTCISGQCQGGTNTCFCKSTADCAAQEDGDACNGTLFCNLATSQCQLNPATVVTCQTMNDTSCQKNLCNPKEGKCHLVVINQGLACDDGNPCTPNEACKSGSCTSAVNTCPCTSDAECLPNDDGNACNGTLYCSLATNECTVNGATVVHCDTDDDPQCWRDVCDPETGVCAPSSLPKDGTACTDGNPCTIGEKCVGGGCVADVNANTCSCGKDADCVAKEDGDACNGTLYCDLSAAGQNKCAVNQGTLVQCSDAFDTTCEANRCSPQTGKCAMTPVHQGNVCGDGSACSNGGWCALGDCASENAQVCQCTANADCAPFEDGDACNGTLFCDKTQAQPVCKVNASTVIVCPVVGGGQCQQNQCVAATGKCAMQPVSGACSDGLACTLPDACLQGKCVGASKPCADSEPCTADNCVEPFGCLHLPGAATPCDDGNACTSVDTCLGGTCTGQKAKCDDGLPCTDDSCNAQTGCIHNPGSGPCSDGDACTAGDGCVLGLCKAGTPTGCDDENPCTGDSCDKASGKCQHSDGATQCSDGNPCTTDSCQVEFGCIHQPNSAACNDGDPCTSGDACKSGTCQPKELAICSDGNPCTDDTCEAKTGCVFKPNTAPCEDGNVCTLKQACKGGLCQGVATMNCDDANQCTDDSCNPTSGCGFVNNTKACNMASCTGGSTCQAGSCVTGPLVQVSELNFVLGGDVWLRGVASFPDGDLAVVGQSGNNVGGIARIGGDGKTKWTLDTGGGIQRAVLVLGDGTIAAFGKANTSNAANVRTLSGDGNVLADSSVAYWWQFVAFAVHPSGGYWAAANDNGYGHLSLARLDAAFKVVATTKGCATCVGNGVASMADGRAVVVGHRTVAGSNLYRGWVGIHGNDGLLQSETLLTDPLTHVALTGIVARPGGGFAAVGYVGSQSTGYTRSTLLALDPQGKLLWEKQSDDPSHVGWYNAVVALADGGLMVAGLVGGGSSGSTDGMLLRTDAFGNPVWQRTYGSSSSDSLEALTIRPGGGVAAVGYRQGVAWVVRTDAWGNSSCLNTGACLEVPFDGCDDKDPCTVDSCVAGSGCKHTALAAGAACAAAFSCDIKGKCTVPLGS